MVASRIPNPCSDTACIQRGHWAYCREQMVWLGGLLFGACANKLLEILVEDLVTEDFLVMFMELPGRID